MKYLFSLSMMSLLLMFATTASAQEDKAKRPSPPAVATAKAGNTTITIDYSQPSLKGRKIGVDVEPKAGQVWRTGANEATTFEVDNDVTIDGKKLPKGKYALFTIMNEGEWTVIFNKTWKQWGAFKYKEADDALKIKVKEQQTDPYVETMKFDVDSKGRVTLVWGEKRIEFYVK